MKMMVVVGKENGIQGRESIAILISDDIAFKMNKIMRKKNRHFIMIKGTVHQENITH